MKQTVHLIPNAHIDSVWMWDAQEGAMEAISTCRTMVALMRKYPELTFVRGERWVYEQILQDDPELFDEIRQLYREGRWDIVGGNYVQSDTNLPNTQTFLKQFEYGKRFFAEHFNYDVKVAWSADSFGQARGLPEIFADAGLKYYAFGRPEERFLHFDCPLFRWRGQGGSELLCYRIPLDWYASERHGIKQRLDDYLAGAKKWGLYNVAVFLGLGDHGGGTSERMIAEIAEYRAEHPEYDVRYSTLTNYFAAAEAEITQQRKTIEVRESEINFIQRGCYASCAKFKFPFRRAEAAVRRASALQYPAAQQLQFPPDEMSGIYRDLLFNTFHDILPGTCVERAYDQQIREIEGVHSAAEKVELHTVRRLLAQMDTTVPPADGDTPQLVPMLVWNPLPRRFHGTVNLELALDYRPVWEYAGKPDETPLEVRDDAGNPVPFQRIDASHHFLPNLPWIRNILIECDIPPCGWKLFSAGYRKQAANPVSRETASAGQDGVLKGGGYEVRIAEDRILISHRGKALFGDKGLSFVTSRDVWGSWGCMQEKPEAFQAADTIETWKRVAFKVLENGPLRARAYAKFTGKHSHLELIAGVSGADGFVELSIRVLWNERATRLSMEMNPFRKVTYQVSGGDCTRGSEVKGDVPGGRYFTGDDLAVASDVIYGYRNQDEFFRATLIRGNRYCTDDPLEADELPERPAGDQGEHRITFRIAPETELSARELADGMVYAPRVSMSDRHPGRGLPRCGSLLEITPACVEAVDYGLEEGRLTLKLQNLSGETVESTVRSGDIVRKIKLSPYRITRVKL